MKLWTPEPPPLSDKILDWDVLAKAGGEDLIRDRWVVDCGPLWGVEALMFAEKAQRYVVLDSSDGILDHVQRVAPRARVHHQDLTKHWDLLSDGVYGLVLDFSTFDDTSAPMACYAEAARVLRFGGRLITTYANADILGRQEEYATHHPQALSDALNAIGFDVAWRGYETHTRAAMICERRAT
jgi:SAM-dependent methyltransferase